MVGKEVRFLQLGVQLQTVTRPGIQITLLLTHAGWQGEAPEGAKEGPQGGKLTCCSIVWLLLGECPGAWQLCRYY
jgi:hypothetical protein